MSISDAAFTVWLESPGKLRCALFELTFLGTEAGHAPPAVEHLAHVANMPFVTRGSDTPANQIFEDCVLEIPSFTRRMNEQLAGRSTQSYGDLVLANNNGVRNAWLSMNWDGRRIRQWLGDPSWPIADFRLVLDGIIVDVYDAGANKIGFHIGDKAALLDRPIMTTLLGGTGPEANDLMPLLIGNFATNITPKLVDPITRAYRITGVDYGGIVERLREDTEITVYEDRAPLQNLAHDPVTANDAATDTFTCVAHGFVEDSRLQFGDLGSGLPAPLVAATNYWVVAAGLTADDFRVSATKGGATLNITGTMAGSMAVTVRNWTMDYPNGGFTIAGNPAGLVTATCWGLRVGGGSSVMYSPANIMTELLTSSQTNTPFTSADLDATNLAAFTTLLGVGLQASYYLTEKTTFAELLDKLVLSVGGWWGFSRDGLLQMGRLDLPSAGTPVYSFTADDIALRSMKLARRILPRAVIKILADINWTVQTAFAGIVSEFDRVFYGRPHTEYIGAPTITDWRDNPTSHRKAVYPDPYQTYFPVGNAGTQGEADRLATMFQTPTAVWSFETHQAVYLLALGNLIYVEHSKFTGYGICVGITERVKGRSTVEFFASLPDVYPTEDIA